MNILIWGKGECNSILIPETGELILLALALTIWGYLAWRIMKE